MRLKDQVAIITGGGSGIGKGIALRFAQEGAKLVLASRNLERLNNAKEEIAQAVPGAEIITVSMDVRNPEDVARMVEETKSAFGEINILVNNAAGNFRVRSEDLSINGWNAVVNIVLNGTWYCTQAVGKEMIAQGKGGNVLNIVATYAWTGAAGVVHSASAKAGVLAMTRSLAVEWGSRYGIRFNAIAPGPITNTGGEEKLFPTDEDRQRVIESNPMRRLGLPEDVAALAAFLVSEEASYINGDCITVDGGAWLSRGARRG